MMMTNEYNYIDSCILSENCDKASLVFKYICICYISLTPNIYLFSLVFSESGRLSFANGKDATHKELNRRRVPH